jgi:hypothetical protein
MTDWYFRMIGNQTVRLWLYQFTFFFFMVFFVGFCAVMPIDAISKASKSTNYALNTFVVVGALVVFGICAAFLTSTRYYRLRRVMNDIPKRYLPLDIDDLPHNCIRMIEKNQRECEHVRELALRTPKDVKHPGLSGPESETLPPLLKFDDVVRAIGLKLKWDNSFAPNSLKTPDNLTFSEIVAFLETRIVCTDPTLNREYVELYEELRYSGKLITEHKFVRFMELSIAFVKNLNANNMESQDNYTHSLLSRFTDDGMNSLRHRSNTYRADEIYDDDLYTTRTVERRSIY